MFEEAGDGEEGFEVLGAHGARDILFVGDDEKWFAAEGGVGKGLEEGVPRLVELRAVRSVHDEEDGVAFGVVARPNIADTGATAHVVQEEGTGRFAGAEGERFLV